MAGKPDYTRRRIIRRMLRSKKWQEASDRAIAKECECSRSLVKMVRMQMIGDGSHPPVTERKFAGDRAMYVPGTPARGGYVYGTDGRVIRETEYRRQQRLGRSTEA